MRSKFYGNYFIFIQTAFSPIFMSIRYPLEIVIMLFYFCSRFSSMSKLILMSFLDTI